MGVPGPGLHLGPVGLGVRSPARAETVGSLLRPPRLRAAVDAFYEAGHSAVLDEERAKDRAALRRREDEAIRDVVRRQIEVGLDVVTDGEFRRWMFLNSFYDAVQGVRTGKTVRFRNDDGVEVELRIHEIAERLRRVDSPAAREAAFLTTATGGHPFKVTFPAASIFGHPFTTVTGAYGSLEEFVEHAIEIERGLVADAIEAGAGYVQFDFPLYPYLVDPAWTARFRSAGVDLGRLLADALDADRRIIQGIPSHVTTGLHICRGNYRSSWMCEGSLEPVAEVVFGDLPYDAFLVEWDDLERDGGFEPARFLRESSIMVLGLISTKRPELEDENDVVRRMERAATIAGGIERLAISPQCGFASVQTGNLTNEDAQWRKLELVAKVADRLWG
jgi:5-methyltetrahydropteroyltriglutamate--homocysteine methyltransferase